jgi:Tetratricopeptide repeat
MKRLFVTLLLLLLPTTMPAQQPSGNAQSMLDQGIQLLDQGKFIEAYDVLSNLKAKYPDSPLLGAAEYQMGLTFLYDNRPVEAALQFQQVISRYPSSEQARQALNMNAILYRLYIAPATDKRVYSADPYYSAGIVDLDEPSGLGVDSEGKVYLADRGKKLYHTFDPAGKLLQSGTILSPYSITVTSKNQVFIGNDSNLFPIVGEPISFPKLNSETQQRAGYLEQIRSAAVNDQGQFFVVSGKAPGVAVFDASHNPLSQPVIGRAEEFGKVLINSRNYIHLLSRKGEFLQVYDPDGKLLTALSKQGSQVQFGKIQDFAIDQADHIYLLTDNPAGIIIYSPQGKFLRFLPSDKKGPLTFEDAKVIAVGANGSIFVCDKATKRVLRIG